MSGIASKTAAKFARLGIFTVSDLLQHYPRDWKDLSVKVPLADYQKSDVCTIVNVLTREWFYYNGQKRLKVYIEDESEQAVLLCYSPWDEKKLIKGDRFKVWGSFRVKYGELSSNSFEAEPASSSGYFGRIMPVYHLTAKVYQSTIRGFMAAAIKKYANDIENELPSVIIERDKLFSKKEALREIHFPSSINNLERAKKTLIYEELFYLEMMIAKRALERKARKKTLSSANNEKAACYSPLQKSLLDRLPFSLTAGQQEAVAQINRDMADITPMARLLQGDVGSGKTLVSFLAALRCVDDGAQAAIMAPTELLARQHAENAARLLEPLGVSIAFLTGNIKAAGRKPLLKNLAAGAVDIVVGTHALFSRDVEYKKLKLVVIDEQHRFGVTQRSLIVTKGEEAGLLMMSATPIPRTLALTVFGDMDVSVIKDMPPGRKPVNTHLTKQSNEKKVYDFVRKELEKGRQSYFVYPLIEGADEIKDAVSMAHRLSKEIFPKYKTALIHSKLPEDEKKQTMDDFRSAKINILAATSVVEVGVDVPNATCMVIEHAERFGLSSLHQLRGRVGRGKDQSYCFLIYSNTLTEDGRKRLIVMLENSDGFVIAEEDLKLRGPGQIAGIEQSGYLVLGIANPIRDIEQLQCARKDAFSILENDPDLLLENNRVIARVLEEAPPFSDVEL
jgi:ATP-dependent DNA helicase RecG